jgi:hypothetical protein
MAGIASRFIWTDKGFGDSVPGKNLRHDSGQMEDFCVQVGQVGHREHEERLQDSRVVGEPVGKGIKHFFSAVTKACNTTTINNISLIISIRGGFAEHLSPT